MAFCMKCGTQLPDEANFCPVCGTKNIISNSDFAQQQKITEINDDVQNFKEPAPSPNCATVIKEKRKLSKGAILTIVIAGTLLLCAIVGLVIWASLDAYYVRQFEEASNRFSSQSPENDLDSYMSDNEDLDTDTDKTDNDDYTDNILAMAEYAGNIIEDISEEKDYLESGLYDSCAVLTDANADDIYELYAVYYKNNSGVPTAHCEVWSLEIGNEKLLLKDTLYTEVGGNAGSMSVCANAGEIYVGVTQCTPQDGRENNRHTYIRLNDLGKSSAQCHVLIENGGYTIDNESVNKTAFDQEMEKYYTLFSIPDNNNDSAMVMSFDEFITIYG